MLPLARPVEEIPTASLATLRHRAAGCRACPLWRGATATVFGKGPPHAAAMLIGEQPGAQQDLAGEPFVGPAGQLLDRAMATPDSTARRSTSPTPSSISSMRCAAKPSCTSAPMPPNRLLAASG